MLCPASVPRITPCASVLNWGLIKVQGRSIKDSSYVRVEAGAGGRDGDRGWQLWLPYPQVWPATSSREGTMSIWDTHDGALYIYPWLGPSPSPGHLKGPNDLGSSGYACPGYIFVWVLQGLSFHQGLGRPREITKILLDLKSIPICILMAQEILFPPFADGKSIVWNIDHTDSVFALGLSIYLNKSPINKLFLGGKLCQHLTPFFWALVNAIRL